MSESLYLEAVTQIVRCSWCGHHYGKNFGQAIEMEHLNICTVYQTKEADEVRDGKEYLKLPGHDRILVQRIKGKGN